MLNVIMLSVIMLSIIMLSVIMLSVIMLSVIMLSITAPKYQNRLKELSRDKHSISSCPTVGDARKNTISLAG